MVLYPFGAVLYDSEYMLLLSPYQYIGAARTSHTVCVWNCDWCALTTSDLYVYCTTAAYLIHTLARYQPYKMQDAMTSIPHDANA